MHVASCTWPLARRHVQRKKEREGEGIVQLNLRDHMSPGILYFSPYSGGNGPHLHALMSTVEFGPVKRTRTPGESGLRDGRANSTARHPLLSVPSPGLSERQSPNERLRKERSGLPGPRLTGANTPPDLSANTTLV